MFEVLDYLLMLAIFSVIRQQVLASVLFLSGSVLAYVVNDKFGISDYYLGRLSALSITFLIGSLLFSTYDFWKEGWKKYAIPGIGVLTYIFSLFTNTSSEWDIFMLIAVPLLIIPAGLSFRTTLTEGRIDISYGMYVYAFPVQQLIINKTGFGFVESLLISLLSVFCLALFSWLFIEKPFLKRKQVQPIKRG